MSASDLILGAALLTAPYGTPETVHNDADWPTIRDAVHKTAVDWEIMDPREVRYVLVVREDFQADLDLLRQRYDELKDAPRLAECARLPDRRHVNEAIKFNRAFKRSIEDRLAWEADRVDVFTQALRDDSAIFVPTGSRLFGTHRPDSDFDFYIQFSKKVQARLLIAGFRQKGDSSYYDVSNIYQVLHRDNVDVILVGDEEMENVVQLAVMMRIHDRDRETGKAKDDYSAIPKELRCQVWEVGYSVYRHMNK